MTWDDGLRAEQGEVAGAPRGNAVGLAGPGTGKTFVVVRRVQKLVEIDGIDPRSILALTFTRAAAAEMRERLQERLGEPGSHVRVSTLHAYALRELLRNGATDLPSPVRVVGDWEERWVVVDELAHMLDRTVRELQDDLARLADDWDTLAADGEGWQEGYPDAQFLGAWRRHREVYGYTLRSELVYQLLCELRSSPSFSPAHPSAVVMVDEYQDLNKCDLTAIRELARRAEAEVFAVGDDDQSIYSFRHAHPLGIRGFDDDYPGSRRMTMTECLRCGPRVVDLANWLIAQEPGRIDKTLRSVTEWVANVALLRFDSEISEAAAVARVVDHAIEYGTLPHEILILMKSDRNGAVSRAIDEQLGGRGIRAYQPRASVATAPALQLLLSYLLLAQSLAAGTGLDHLALRALLQLEDNRVGEGRLRAILDVCLERGLRFAEGLEYLRANPAEYRSNGLAVVLEAADNSLHRATLFAQQPDETFAAWLDRVCVEAALDDLNRGRVHDLATDLMDEAGEEDRGTARDFVQELIGAMSGLSDALPPRVEGQVTITTMHGAKGLSADLVIVLQIEDEVIPGDATGPDLDEARRLLYVSLTRARKQLVLCACERRLGTQRFVGAREVRDRSLTRFLRDYGLTAQTIEAYLQS